jgi:ABC-type transport system involved in cytochrome bd biosynthesis fused ATPase/permease subunit
MLNKEEIRQLSSEISDSLEAQRQETIKKYYDAVSGEDHKASANDILTAEIEALKSHFESYVVDLISAIIEKSSK